MLRDVSKLWAICALAHLGTLTASADALPLKQSLKLGKPARALELELAEGDSLVLRVDGAAFTLPVRKARSAEVEVIAVAEDAAVAIVRVSAENSDWLALVGGRSGKELLLVERSDLAGDPGERRATSVVLTPVPDSPLRQIAVGTRYEGLARCGDKDPWLSDRRQLDAKTLKLVPSTNAPRAESGTALEATKSDAAVGPRLQLLSAASSAQIDPLTRAAHVPHELIDQRPETTWPVSTGTMALLRWSAPSLPITRIELQLSGRKVPVALNLAFEGAAFHVQLPKPTNPVERFAIALPANTISSCLSLEPSGPVTSGYQIAELQAFSEVDQPEGVERLVSELVQDGPRSALAAELLAQLGPAAAQQVAARFAELSARGQRRALKVLAPVLALPEARAHVVESARSKDVDLSRAALEVLRSGKEAGVSGLRELALEPGATGDAAARWLAAPGVVDADGLLAALALKGGADRPGLRRALISVARREPAKFRSASERWLATSPALSARIGLALAAVLADLDDLAGTLAEQALSASEFADRFRLCLVVAELGPAPAIDAWLAEQSQKASEWMARRAAYDALVLRGSSQASSLAPQIAQDGYPRVRAAAVHELARVGQAKKLTELAQKDPWPLVRAAATDALGAVPNSRPVLEELLSDSSRHVRAASIDALVAQRSAGSWPRVAQRLSAENEWPVVQAAAVRFAAALCIQASRPPLAETARRALRPDASDEDRRLGLEAIHALHDLGGEAGEDARLIATREAASADLKQAFAAFGPAHCTAQAAAVAP